MIIRPMVCGVLLALSLAKTAHTSAANSASPGNSGPPWTAQASVESSYKNQVRFHVNGESFTLFIRVPLTPPPPQGYAVMYVLDGDFNFGTAADVARTLNTGPNPPVVVAIGHDLFGDVDVVRRYALRPPGDHTPIGLADVGGVDSMLRFHDYTLPVAENHRAPAWTGLTPDNVGGLDQFLQVIETEIKPRVMQLVPTNAADTAIFGHSIAGPRSTPCTVHRTRGVSDLHCCESQHVVGRRRSSRRRGAIPQGCREPQCDPADSHHGRAQMSPTAPIRRRPLSPHCRRTGGRNSRPT